MKSVTVEWRHKIEATSEHQHGQGARSVVAWLLRHLADRLDDGQSLRVTYSTTPAIPTRLAADCIERGMAHANQLLAEMAHQEACDQALADVMPELFKEAGQ